MHDDEQIGILALQLGFQNGLEIPDYVRSRLDLIRGFLIKGQRQAAQMPKRRERNAALAILCERIRAFEAAINALTPLPGWPLVDVPETEDLLPSRVFSRLPDRLRMVAAMARAASRDCAQDSNAPYSRASLLSISASADDLADTLLVTDFASQDDVLKHLPWSEDYAMNTVSEVVGISNRLSSTVQTALQVGRRSPGPRASGDLRQAVFWLGQLFEECGGRFTHTPRDKTHYDARPHSPAGLFVLTFTNMCDKTIRPETVTSAMAEVVKSRARPADALARGGSF